MSGEGCPLSSLRMPTASGVSNVPPIRRRGNPVGCNRPATPFTRPTFCGALFGQWRHVAPLTPLSLSRPTFLNGAQVMPQLSPSRRNASAPGGIELTRRHHADAGQLVLEATVPTGFSLSRRSCLSPRRVAAPGRQRHRGCSRQQPNTVASVHRQAGRWHPEVDGAGARC
jgi:hypothetical protein